MTHEEILKARLKASRYDQLLNLGELLLTFTMMLGSYLWMRNF